MTSKMTLTKMEDMSRTPGWHARSTEFPCQAWAPTREGAIEALRILIVKHKTDQDAKARGETNWTPDVSGSSTVKV